MFLVRVGILLFIHFFLKIVLKLNHIIFQAAASLMVLIWSSLPNPFLPRSPGGGTSTDRSASNPLNLIKPPFSRKIPWSFSSPFFESTPNFDHICCLFYQFKLFLSRISPLYMFKNHSLIGHGTLLQTFAPFWSFFLANTNHLIRSRKKTSLWDVTAVWWLLCSTQIIFCSRFVRDTNH